MFNAPHDPAHRAVRVELTVDADPGALPRVLAPFARRDLTPDVVRCRRGEGTLFVEVCMARMPMDQLHLIEGNLRQIIGMRRVTVEMGPAAQAA